MSEAGCSSEAIAKNFYSSSTSLPPKVWSECVLNVKKSYNESKSKPFPPLMKSSLTGPSVSWKVFKRQSEALSFADAHTKDCMVFAYEEKTATSGQRLFLVTHPQHMWLNHKSRIPEERCTYEVIREGDPCKLYFDLEFSKMHNPSKDGSKMTKVFIKCVIAALHEKFSLNFQPSDFLWLDASTPVKYSSHLILQMEEVAFVNNVQAGYFVSTLLEQINIKVHHTSEENSLWPPPDELKTLYVQNSDERICLFCDHGVYTKNRNFRLYLSTKCGKRAPFLLSKQNQYIPDTSTKESDIEEVIFYDSMVTYFRKNKNFTKLLLQEQVNLPISTLKKTTNTQHSESITGVQNIPSPYPEVDSFVSSIVKDELTSGYIRKWTYLDSQDILVYEIVGYRYCNNVGRHHKSNNIMIIVDMKKKEFYQKCHDPDCRAQDYKSIAKGLPEQIKSLYTMPDDFFDENCFSQLNEETNFLNSSSNKENAMSKEEDNQTNLSPTFDFDSYPFTQLREPMEEANLLKKTETTLFENRNNHVDAEEIKVIEEAFSNDTSFDDLNMEDLEAEFVSFSTQNGNPNLGLTSAVPTADPSTNIHDISEKGSDEDISMEEELLIAEAADAIEFNFEDNFSEETIF